MVFQDFVRYHLSVADNVALGNEPCRPTGRRSRPAPLLFVLDEPTASLDAPSESAILERSMRRARTLAARTGASP